MKLFELRLSRKVNQMSAADGNTEIDFRALYYREKKRVEELENETVMQGSILEAVNSALLGEPVSDFMESFPLVGLACQTYAFAQQAK